jgi:hypothetical protein
LGVPGARSLYSLGCRVRRCDWGGSQWDPWGYVAVANVVLFRSRCPQSVGTAAGVASEVFSQAPLSRLDSLAPPPGSGMIPHQNLIHPSVVRVSLLEARGRPLFRDDRSRVDPGPLYVSVCHGSHRTVFSLASRNWGASEYRTRVTGQGKSREIPRLSTRYLPTRPHERYLPGSVSTTKPASYQYVSRVVLRNKRRCTSLDQSVHVRWRSLWWVSFLSERHGVRDETLGLVLLDCAWSER